MLSAVLRFLPFNVRAHKSSACSAWTAAPLRLIWRMLPSRITLAAFVLFIPRCHCLTFDGNVHFNSLSFFYTWDIVRMCDMRLRCLFKLSLSHWYKSCFFLCFNTNYLGNYCICYSFIVRNPNLFSRNKEGEFAKEDWFKKQTCIRNGFDLFIYFFRVALQIPLSPSIAKPLVYAY